MTRTVNCRKYHQELPGLERPPYPGAKGQDIFDNISQQAWGDWLKHQTLLINEKRLNMMNAEDRKFLQVEMDKYFSGEDYAKAEGYVPPSELPRKSVSDGINLKNFQKVVDANLKKSFNAPRCPDSSVGRAED